jgi:hypothetical protein
LTCDNDTADSWEDGWCRQPPIYQESLRSLRQHADHRTNQFLTHHRPQSGARHSYRHEIRARSKFDAQAVLAGSRDSARCIGYLTKYLTKQLGDCHHPDTDVQRDHVDRLADALRYEPCSPTCANWLRYGIQPKNPRPGLVPGACKGKAHRRDHLGYAGRRVLVSRKWSGKTLADHRGDRKAWLTETLGLEAPDPARYTWHVVASSDHDYLPPDKRLLHIVADRAQRRAALAEAKRKAQERDDRLSSTGKAA